MDGEMIEAKTCIWGFSLNLREVWRRLKGEQPRAEEDGVGIVAQQLRELFAGHDLKLQHASKKA